MAVHRASGALLSALLATSLGVPGVATAASVVAEPAGALPSDSLGVLHPLDRDHWGDDTTHEGDHSTAVSGQWQAQYDHGSMWYTTQETGAQDVWLKSDPNKWGHKLTGYGVGVALIDTGIAPVDGLTTTGKVINGPDLSFDSQASNTRYLDGYGHGTHMAAIIAGKDSAVVTGNESDSKKFVGMAPDATLINVKVGAADGSADVSQIVAAIDWVVENRTTNNIRVLNLSYGTDSTQSSTLDPLAHAVENAWRAGIVVVVAAGNEGVSGATRLTMPAADPYVIAVGSSDNSGSGDHANTKVGAWTNNGNSSRRPDLLAPGKSVVSLRVPGSLVDTKFPEGLIPGDSSGRMLRGTGTSQSAAVVSGAAALLLQRNPSLTPNQVKGLLRSSADKLSTSDSTQGAGDLNVKDAVTMLEGSSLSSYSQSWTVSTGKGSLEAARAGSYVADPSDGSVLRGEQDIFGVAWDAPTWAAASKSGTAWSGGTWRGTTWAGTGWSGTTWATVPWARYSWSGLDWSRYSWSGLVWSRYSWSGLDWSRYSWSGLDWSRYSWAGLGW
ncbi:MAG: S8 family serine peptidase [Actinobacteria bacterium]|nr:S8 family serine peptidase [Actinomycetota bacterium]